MTASQISKKVGGQNCVNIITIIYLYTILPASDPKHQQEAFLTSINKLICSAKNSFVQNFFI